MTDLYLQRGRLIDPSSGLDQEGDLLIREGRIEALGPDLTPPEGIRVLDARDLWITPGLIDLHVHLREPGQEYKETIESGCRSAAAGGFTAVCSMPNTTPPNDSRAVTEYILRQAKIANSARVYPLGAISVGQKGERLAEIGEMAEAGICALTDDGFPVMDALLMRRAMEYGRTFGLTLCQHAEDSCLSKGGVMNEGIHSTRAGLRGIPAAAETTMVERDIRLVELTGAHYHVAHISTSSAVEAVRQAKARGLPVSCEVTPHHLYLTDHRCLTYDTSTKMNPPLRTDEDVEAMRVGLADGTIDAVATDHAPHSSIEKDIEFEDAAFGIVGLETALPLVLKLVQDGLLTEMQAIDRLSTGPARIYQLPGGSLQVGSVADVTVIDPEYRWQVDPEAFESKGRNTPFTGWDMTGRAIFTVVGGQVVHEQERTTS